MLLEFVGDHPPHSVLDCNLLDIALCILRYWPPKVSVYTSFPPAHYHKNTDSNTSIAIFDGVDPAAMFSSISHAFLSLHHCRLSISLCPDRYVNYVQQITTFDNPHRINALSKTPHHQLLTDQKKKSDNTTPIITIPQQTAKHATQALNSLSLTTYSPSFSDSIPELPHTPHKIHQAEMLQKIINHVL